MSLCPTLVTGGTRALGKVLFPRRSVRVESARRNTQGLCPILLPPLPRTLDTSQFLQHQSGEGAFIHRWDDPKEGSWRWEPDHRETWTHRAFQSSSSPEASHPLGAVGVVSLQEGPSGSGGCGTMWRGAGSPGPRGRAHWLAHPPQLCQPHDSPSLGNQPAQASGM